MSGSTSVHALDHFCIMGSVGDSYRCPLCGRKGRGSDANACVGYPICTVGANSCLGKILTPPGSNPCDIVGAALRCILKGTALFLQEYIYIYIYVKTLVNVLHLTSKWWRCYISNGGVQCYQAKGGRWSNESMERSMMKIHQILL